MLWRSLHAHVQRIQRCKALGFKGIQPTRTDGYLVTNGFGLTAAQYKDYVVWLAKQAAAAGMGIGLQDSIALVDVTTASYFNWAVSVQCLTRGNCCKYKPFSSGEGSKVDTCGLLASSSMCSCRRVPCLLSSPCAV